MYIKGNSVWQCGFILGMQDYFHIRKSIRLIYHINRKKLKNYMSIPTDAEKVFDKIQYPFTIENLSGQEIENNFVMCV